MLNLRKSGICWTKQVSIYVRLQVNSLKGYKEEKPLKVRETFRKRKVSPEPWRYYSPAWSSLLSYRLYVMHLDALLGFGFLAGFGASVLFLLVFFTPEVFSAGCLLTFTLMVQLLFVQRPSIISEPHSQNSANFFTPILFIKRCVAYSISQRCGNIKPVDYYLYPNTYFYYIII